MFAWKDAKLRLGSSIANADAQTPTAVNNFTITINNNSVAHYRSGSQDVSFISQGNLTVEGSFTLFFNSTTEKNNYYNVAKQAMTLMIQSGRDIGGGLYDEIKLEFPQIRYQEHPIETGVDELFVETVNFVAEYATGSSMTMDAIIQNRKSAYS
jgi:argonaute-like protein implicated in RNA metabolism and viral defense